MLWFIEHFFCGSRYWFSGIKSCGCCGRLVTATATRAEGLVKSYGSYSYGDYLLRVDSGLQCGAEVLNENLLCIWKRRYLSKSLVIFRDSVTLK